MRHSRMDGSVLGGQTPMTAWLDTRWSSTYVGRMMPWTSWNTALDREMEFLPAVAPPGFTDIRRFAFRPHCDGGWELFPDRRGHHSGQPRNGVGILCISQLL